MMSRYRIKFHDQTTHHIFSNINSKSKQKNPPTHPPTHTEKHNEYIITCWKEYIPDEIIDLKTKSIDTVRT